MTTLANSAALSTSRGRSSLLLSPDSLISSSTLRRLSGRFFSILMPSMVASFKRLCALPAFNFFIAAASLSGSEVKSVKV